MIDEPDEKSVQEKLNEIFRPNDFKRAVLTVSDGSQVYITTHMFFEDLAVVNENMLTSATNLPEELKLDTNEEIKDQPTEFKFEDENAVFSY